MYILGHVAVPLCPDSDQERLELMLMETQSDLVITTSQLVNRVHHFTKVSFLEAKQG